MSETHIFNSKPVSTESWSLQGAVVMWGTGSGDPSKGIPLIMNQINVRYAVPVSTFTPLNTDDNGQGATRILIKGIPEGTLQVQSIFTPNVSNLKNFIEACQKSCKTANDQVKVSIRPFGTLECTNSSTGETAKFRPGGIVFYLDALDLREFNFTISQQDNIAMTNMPLTFQFFDLSFDDAKSTGTTAQTSEEAYDQKYREIFGTDR